MIEDNTIWHELKTWPKYFEAIRLGEKFFELRKNDRNFKTGDYLVLKEWNPDQEKYTGKILSRRIVGILDSVDGKIFGLKEGYCIMSISKT